jgi:DNA-binding CsgD family transcriptional regulator
MTVKELPPKLTDRQLEVLRLIVLEGATAGEIAERLGIAETTAKYHIRELRHAFDVQHKRELIGEAYRLGFVTRR